MFFNNTNFFLVSSLCLRSKPRNVNTTAGAERWPFLQAEQGTHSLRSYVVASSVGNLSISGLTEPVEIEIAHIHQQVRVTARVRILASVMTDDELGNMTLSAFPPALTVLPESSLHVLGLQHEQ